MHIPRFLYVLEQIMQGVLWFTTRNAHAHTLSIIADLNSTTISISPQRQQHRTPNSTIEQVEPRCKNRLPSSQAPLIRDLDCRAAVNLVNQDLPTESPYVLWYRATFFPPGGMYRRQVPYIKHYKTCEVLVNLRPGAEPERVAPSDHVIRMLYRLRKRCVSGVGPDADGGVIALDEFGLYAQLRSRLGGEVMGEGWSEE